MRVYHGSTQVIEKPMAMSGRANLDFGRGFYVTNIRTQARRWASIKGRLSPNASPVVNTYYLDMAAVQSHFRYKRFEHYDSEWLHFIVDCRMGGTGWKQWDVIEGGVANDRVIDTVENYMADLIDEQRALGQLALHQPNNQICISNQVVIDQYLRFEKHDTLKETKK